MIQTIMASQPDVLQVIYKGKQNSSAERISAAINIYETRTEGRLERSKVSQRFTAINSDLLRYRHM